MAILPVGDTLETFEATPELVVKSPAKPMVSEVSIEFIPDPVAV